MPKILAIDAATQCGVASAEAGETPHLETVNFGDSGDNHLEVGARCLKWIAHRLTDDRPDQIWMEEPLSFEAAEGRSSGASRVRLNGLYMVIGAAARLKGVPVHPVRITTARKGFLGHGGLKRQEAKKRSRAMCRLLGWAPMTDDEADAGCLFWFASVANGKGQLISKLMQKQIVEVLPFRRRDFATDKLVVEGNEPKGRKPVDAVIVPPRMRGG
jgi:hypothetical protein